VSSDRGYILEHWVRSYSGTAEGYHAGPHYMPGHWRLAAHILDRARCLVAAAESEPDVILGFVVAEGEVLHYVYVDESARRQGIARQLLATYIGRSARYSHMPTHHAFKHGRVEVLPPKQGQAPRRRLPIPDGWTYDPYCRWFGSYDASRRTA
jgi:GNAT superfamily N-acetyltransferase